MRVEDLVFETVGCCETHIQAKAEKDGMQYYITMSDNLYNVAVYNNSGLVSRHNRITAADLGNMI